jgi:hypothetical protein
MRLCFEILIGGTSVPLERVAKPMIPPLMPTASSWETGRLTSRSVWNETTCRLGSHGHVLDRAL